MAVVEVSETYSRYGQLTGWEVVSWDGYKPLSKIVPVHKGEPHDGEIDVPARDEWKAWEAERTKARKWQRDVWEAVRREAYPIEVGDIVTGKVSFPAGYTTYRDGHPVGILASATVVTLPMLVCDVTATGSVELRSASDQLPYIPPDHHPLLSQSLKLSPEILRLKRMKAVLDLSHDRDTFLWELVFDHPESEHKARWLFFIDALREGRWGDDFARMGEHLAELNLTPNEDDE